MVCGHYGRQAVGAALPADRPVLADHRFGAWRRRPARRWPTGA
ncbi:hypothetical protein LJR300_002438 [Caulobacter sp. LjRoot300]